MNLFHFRRNPSHVFDRLIRFIERSGSAKVSGIAKRIAKGSFWNLLGAISFRGAAIAASIFVARLLGAQDFGKFSMILSTVLMFQIFGEFGVGLTATKYIAEYRDAGERIGGIISLLTVSSIFIGSFFSLLLVWAAPWLCRDVLGSPGLTVPLIISVPAIFFGAYSGFLTGALAGFESFKSIAKAGLASALVGLPARIIPALWGLKWAIVGISAGAFISCGFRQAALSLKMREAGIALDLKRFWQERKILVDFSLPSVLTNILIVPVTWASSAMLARHFSSFSEVAVFNIATQWKTALLFIPAVIGEASMPILAQQQSIGNNPGIRSTIKSLLIAFSIIAVPAMIILCCLSPFIMGAYGRTFRDSWPTFVIMQIAVLLQVVESPAIKFVEATGRMWTNLVLNIAWSSIVLGLGWALLSRGALGLALAQTVAFSAEGVCLLVILFRCLPGREVSLQSLQTS